MTLTDTASGRRTLAARNAVAVVFALNGLCFATWVARIPGVRGELGLDNVGLGLLLLSIAIGSLLALPTAGPAIHALGTVTVNRLGGVLAAAGLTASSVGVSVGSVVVTAAGLFCYGIGTSVWDVAMNVEGAAVERGLGRAIMPRFHAGFSLGTMLGAGVGALLVAFEVPIAAHLTGVGVASMAIVWLAGRAYLPVEEPEHEAPAAGRWASWLEPRTLLVGLMVLVFAMTEGTANDWLAVALIDGYGVDHSVGVLGFAAFVTAMTVVRIFGTGLLDRFGRVPVLWSTMVAAFAGVLLVVYGAHPALVVAGIALWGSGAALGFPVGMSAAADDPRHAAARVSVVATVGYGAFLAGPPLFAAVAEAVGTLQALLVLAGILVPAACLVPAAREPRRPAGQDP